MAHRGALQPLVPRQRLGGMPSAGGHLLHREDLPSWGAQHEVDFVVGPPISAQLVSSAFSWGRKGVGGDEGGKWRRGRRAGAGKGASGEKVGSQ